MRLRHTLLLALSLSLVPAVTHAGWMDRFVDPEDGAFDTSKYLLEHRGVLPVPMLITEPAVGYGVGMVLAFFQQSLAELASERKPGTHYRPPNIYAAGGALTENGTWGAAAGGLVSFREDDWRWRGGGGYASLELTYYLEDGTTGGAGYSLDGVALVNHLLYRLGGSDTWLVARWVYLDIESAFDTQSDLLPTLENERRSSGIGPSLEYDSRDTIFTPSAGWQGSVDALFYDPAFGGDATFQTYRAHVFAYVPLAKVGVLGTRLDGRMERGDTPFYMRPYISLRGIPALRYQGENTALVESELRWDVTRRWSVMGFVGAGRAWDDSFDEEETRVAGGTGFRYLIARQMKMYSGLDFAWGPEDFAFYIQVGNAWR